MENYTNNTNTPTKYCIHCGHEMPADSNFCPECGKPQNYDYNEPQQYVESNQSNSNTLKLIAYIIMLITTILSAFALIPLLWMIPMTIKTYHAYKGTEQLTTGFKVCVLIFCNTISGILLLVDNN